MGQTSGPLTNALFTDEQWRTLIGGEPGIVGDTTGASYGLTLPSSSNTALLGAATQRSAAAVAGFAHVIPAGETEPLTIPDSVGGAVTHRIVLRYDPAWAGAAPGPVRLALVSGAPGGGIPAVDGGYPGIEEMALWQLTRQPGQALSQITPVDLRVRTGPVLHVPMFAALPVDVPIGTLAVIGADRDADVLVRSITSVSSGAVEWVRAGAPRAYLESSAPPAGIAVPSGVPTWLGWQQGAVTGDTPVTLSAGSITAIRRGTYALHVYVQYPTIPGAGLAYVQAEMLGSGQPVARVVHTGSNVASLSIPCIRLQAGEGIGVNVYQSSGGTVGVNAVLRASLVQVG